LFLTDKAKNLKRVTHHTSTPKRNLPDSKFRR
jgi:hypothetical protein